MRQKIPLQHAVFVGLFEISQTSLNKITGPVTHSRLHGGSHITWDRMEYRCVKHYDYLYSIVPGT